MLVKETTRKLARIVQIAEIRPVPKADRLEIAVVDGWEVVVQKGLYKVGDIAVYFEIDSSIPMDHPILDSFDKQYLKTTKDQITGKDYALIKSIRLRGALSQGLVIQAQHFPGSVLTQSDVGWDVTETLGVLKYITPAEAKLYFAASEGPPVDASNTKKLLWKLRAWLTKGIIVDGLQPFPAGHVRSEEERVQNIPQFYNQLVNDDEDVEASIKLDGESTTFYTDLESSGIGCAQRNYSLRMADVPYTPTEQLRVYASEWVRFIARRLAGGECAWPTWKKGYLAQSVPMVSFFHRNEIRMKIEMFNALNFDFMKGGKLAVQGEMVGPGFNKNKEGLDAPHFFVYRAYRNGNIRLTPDETKKVCDATGLTYIPLAVERMKLPPMKDLLKLADGPAVFDPKRKREGLVIKSHKSGFSFKVISNKWLEKSDEAEASDEEAPVVV